MPDHWLHEAPRIRDRSFTDFIADPAHCPDQNLVVDIDSTEKRIFNKCSSFYNLWRQKVVDGLGGNEYDGAMTNGINPDCSVQEQYACLYWASHLTNIKDVDESAQYHLDDRCLLRWIETMALLGMLREAVMHLDQVRTWMTSVKGQTDRAPDRLVDLMDNAFRLLLHHATTISYDSLLVYDSALFTTAMGFHLQVEHELASIQGPTFKLCYDFTLALAWSPNSQHIALSRANGIEIRDALSGSIVDSFGLSLETKLEYVLYPQKVSCHRLAFYPDNSRIAYVTRDGKVHVRNTLSRTEEFVVTGHDSEGGLVSINVSPNGKLLVSGSKSGRIQVCNAQNGALVWAVETDTKLKSTVLEHRQDGSLRPVAISDCGRYLAVYSWNPNLKRITTQRIASNVLSNVAQPNSFTLNTPDSGWFPCCQQFFPNSTRFVATFQEKIFTWDASVAHPEATTSLVGHTKKVNGLYFLPDGSRLLSRAGEEVFAWNVDTLQLDRGYE
ncbi:hypothetical protein EDB84DRAFT_1678134 [Lactarius hengduanensis]|nr:hypothetical protein EDB84DRAFT_1678134 [Lactarius hengduanensis]